MGTGRHAMGENLQWTGTNHGGVNDSKSYHTQKWCLSSSSSNEPHGLERI